MVIVGLAEFSEICLAALLPGRADLSSGIAKVIYPFDWTPAAGYSPGAFFYSLGLGTSVTLSLHINGVVAGQPATIKLPAADVSNSAQVNATAAANGSSQFSFLMLPAVRQVGQAITLQLTSNATNFTALHANSTGWRVEMLRPNNTWVNLGLMQDGAVLPGLAGPVHQWTLNITGEQLTLVRWLRAAQRLLLLGSLDSLHTERQRPRYASTCTRFNQPRTYPCLVHAHVVQAWAYRFQVVTPSVMLPVVLAANTLWTELRAGNATAASSSYTVVPPLSAVVGSNITVNIMLNDACGNAAAARNATQLALSGEWQVNMLCTAPG